MYDLATELPPLLILNMIYLAVETDYDKRRPLEQTTNSGKRMKGSKKNNRALVYMSMVSLSFNEKCRALVSDTIFFSPKHEVLRAKLVSNKFLSTAFGNNPLLVPNGPNLKTQARGWRRESATILNNERARFQHTASPTYLDSA